MLTTELESVFTVPRLNQASVACGGCCPVPAEALIVPELEQLPGVHEASADWHCGEVRVRHTARVQADELAEILADLSYPAEAWVTLPAS